MKHIGKSSLSFAMEIILIAIMAINALVLIFLPQVITYYLRMNHNIGVINQKAKIILMIILYPCGLFSFIVVLNLKKIFRTLVDRDPFIQKNVKSLKAMGFAMVGVTVFLAAKIILLNSMMTMLGALASGLLAVFCFVLADVFQQAVYYKEDNELTI